MIGNFIDNEIITKILIGVFFLGSLHFFAMKSATANASLNSGLNIYQLISVMFAKTFVVLLFVLALQRQREVYKNEDRVAGGIGIAILLQIGSWFSNVSMNANQVFEKRGLIKY